MSVTGTVTIQSIPQGRRAFCGSVLNFSTDREEVMIEVPNLIYHIREQSAKIYDALIPV
jgi:hypothetical protein